MHEIDRQLQRAAGYFSAGQALHCWTLCNQILADSPGHAQALHLRGMAAIQLQRLHEAATDLAAAWAAQRKNVHAAFWLGRVLRQTGHYQQALAPLRAATADPALETDARYELARTLIRVRASQQAMEQYRLILELRPDHADSAANLAALLERANQLDESERHASQALQVDPQNFMGRLAMATVQRRTERLDEAANNLQTLLRQQPGVLNHSIVLNQLGQCHEQSGSYEAALGHFKAANDALREKHPLGQPVARGSYGLDTIRAYREWLALNPPAQWSPGISQHDDPVFLVGFPRSGTTLLDQALSAHPRVEVLEEFECFEPVRRRWIEHGQLQQIPAMSQSDLAEARNTYLEQLRAHRTMPDRPVIVDKLPLNLLYLFLIHRLFPASPILFMLRDPRDACLSCYCQMFDLQGAMPYFLDLDDTSRYYSESMLLATETEAVIGNPLLRLRYEDLVTAFEPSMRALVDFLGLEWEPAVLNYRDRVADRFIDTPSYQQVIKPLHTRSIGRWRNFRAGVEPTFGPLAQWIDRFGYNAH